MKWRITFLTFSFCVLFLFLISEIYNLQIEEGRLYSTKAINQESAGGSLEPLRGNIYFTNKNQEPEPAVLNKEYPIIYVDPKEIQREAKNKGEALAIYAEQLSAVVGKPAAELEKQLNKVDDTYELLVQKASAKRVAEIKALNIKGVYVKNQFLRYYSFGDLASHLLGFVAPSDDGVFAGRYGVEKQFNELLAGNRGSTSENNAAAPENGENLHLTIDPSIQTQAENILKTLIEDYSASGGTAIVQEPQTGKILAMVSFPDFDPNNYPQYPIKSFLNPAAQLVYEPGSVFKVITMAAGIDSNKITPETIYTDTGAVVINGEKIENWDLKARGQQTMTNVIEYSINTGAVFAQQKIGPDIFYNYLVKFGLNVLTGIKLPGEVKGNLNNLKKGRPIDFATASFGQGVAVTPIELISAVSAIANGGLLMKPYVLVDDKPDIVRRVISQETAKKVVDMMVSAVVINKIADIPSYSVAGKTGTAFIPDFEKKTYTEDVINTYVGFAPAYNPKFIVLIKLEKPAGAPLAGLTVVPAFRELAGFILNYYNIPPDKLATSD